MHSHHTTSAHEICAHRGRGSSKLTLPMHGGLQLDLFLAQPDNWGLTLLVHTGSAAFSTALLARWKRRHGIGRDQPGSIDGRLVARDGRVVPTPEEETVFVLRARGHRGPAGLRRARKRRVRSWRRPGVHHGRAGSRRRSAICALTRSSP
jgi:hypothetical protein